jgi:hypothetical protein
MRETEIGIARRIIEPHLKTLWWWQRSHVLDCVTECLECCLHGNEARFYEIIDQLRGKPKRVLLLCLRDALKYVEFTGNQLLEAMERFK